MTLQQIVLSKNPIRLAPAIFGVLTLQQIVLSKNPAKYIYGGKFVLTLQQIVLSKNLIIAGVIKSEGFDFTTNCSF